MSTPKVSQKNSQQRTLSSFFTVTKPLPLNEKSSNNAEETSVKRPVSDLYEHADAGKLDLNLKVTFGFTLKLKLMLILVLILSYYLIENQTKLDY